MGQTASSSVDLTASDLWDGEQRQQYQYNIAPFGGTSKDMTESDYLHSNFRQEIKTSKMRQRIREKSSEISDMEEQRVKGVDIKLLKELAEDDVDENIIEEEIEQLTEEYDLRAVTCRQRMVHFLHTFPVEIFMITLVIVDVFVILAMVALDLYILQEELSLLQAKGGEVLDFFRTKCEEVDSSILKETTIKDIYENILKQSSGSMDINEHVRNRRAASPNLEDFGSKNTFEIAKLIYSLTAANHILHYSSIAILAVFVIEVGLKMIGYGCHFFKNKWEVIDGIVIVISFALDIAVTDAMFSPQVGKALLVVFLIWRVIRILNAMVLTSRARTMFRLRVLKKSKRLAEGQNRQLTVANAELQTEVKKLRGLARTYGADEHAIHAASVLSKSNTSNTKAGLKSMMAQILFLNTHIVSASCTSLNSMLSDTPPIKRRPSLIGDQIVCQDAHEVESPNELTTVEMHMPPMRERSASDADAIKLSRKFRAVTEWRKKKSHPAKNQHRNSINGSMVDILSSTTSQDEHNESTGYFLQPKATADKEQSTTKPVEGYLAYENLCYQSEDDVSDTESEHVSDLSAATTKESLHSKTSIKKHSAVRRRQSHDKQN